MLVAVLIFMADRPVWAQVAPLTGTGEAVEFLTFDFVEMAGRAGHEGLFPIQGEPLRGIVHTARARLSGPVQTAEFRLVSRRGGDIGPLVMTQGSPDAGRQDYVGAFEPPLRRFRVAVSGLDGAGAAYDLVYPTLYRARVQRIGFDPVPATLLAGTNSLSVTLENTGLAGSFELRVGDSHGFVTRVDPPVLDLDSGSSGRFEVTLSVPLGLPGFTTAVLDAAVTRPGDPEVLNTGRLALTIEDGNSLTAARDSTLRRDARNDNEGANPRLLLGRGRDSGGDGGDVDGDRVVDAPIVAFDGAAIEAFIDANGLSRATLTLTIAENRNNWTGAGQTVDARPIATGFTEGNGRAAELPASERTRGFGAGVTWNCPADRNIANRRRDCRRRWHGGRPDPASAAPVVHFDGQAGAVSWDVTGDVAFGGYAWIVRKTDEFDHGRLLYFSREGAADSRNAELGPLLTLE